MEAFVGREPGVHSGSPGGAPTQTEAQAARQRALMRQAAKRAQLAGGPRVAAAPAASAGGDSEGSDDSEGDEDEEDAEQGGSTGARAGGKRPAAKGKAGAEAERERKRMRRLLRNRVSAQLARERKKQHAMAVETRAQELEGKESALQARVVTLERENSSLRQVLRTTLRHRALAVAPVF